MITTAQLRNNGVTVMLVAIIVGLVAFMTFQDEPERTGPPQVRLVDGIDGERTQFVADTIFIDLMRENKSKLRIAWTPTDGGIYQVQAVVVIPEPETDSTSDSLPAEDSITDSAQ